LAVDSVPFTRPDAGHRDSPFFKVALRLHTVASARARYNAFASSEWERQHAGPIGGYLDANNEYCEFPRPTNPYLDPEPAH
jgi:hypothetical protein